MNIAVLLGGISTERNVSIASGKAVGQALSERGHTISFIDPSLGHNCIIQANDLISVANETVAQEYLNLSPRVLLECVQSPAFDTIDIAFSLLHGKCGEDGIMQALLEARGVRYAGSKVMASALAMDKVRTKLILSAAGVQSPEWSVLYPQQFNDYERIEHIMNDLGGTIVIKPNTNGSSVGLSIVDNDIDHAIKAVQLASQYDSTILIERYIAGREVTVAVLGDQAFPVIEIVPEQGWYDYQNKYTKGNTQYYCPADITNDERDFLQNLAVTAHRIVGCTAYSRIDFRLDEDGVPWCLEVNTIPGFTETSLVPMAAQSIGISYGELCERIIALS